MATATTTLTKNSFPAGSDFTGRRHFTYGTVAVQASPATYVTGGLTLSFAGLDIPSTYTTPLDANFKSNAGSGFTYLWNAATNKLQIFTGAAAQSALTELTNGAAIPAGVSGDVIAFNAAFPKNI